MILTPLSPDLIPGALERFAGGLTEAISRVVFGRIADPRAAVRVQGRKAALHHQAALGLVASVGMAALPGSPAEDCAWNGHAVRTGTEAYVLLHEVAHFQLAAPERRRRIDFGLGPGPETGNRAAAEEAARLFGLEREREEAAASLLGILWEVDLGQPALASFLDQNWLEGVGPAVHFETVLDGLVTGGFVTADGRPTRRLRMTADPSGPQHSRD